MRAFSFFLAILAIAWPVASRAAPAPSVTLQPALAGLGFLLGRWGAGAGRVAETGGRSAGSSSFIAQAGGGVLVRRDHTELFDKAGQRSGSFDQLMTIYAEGGAIHADYFDGVHVIHYTNAKITPGQSVVFSTAAATGAPNFQLSYAVKSGTLSVAFAMAPPGSTAFHPIAAGTLRQEK